MSVSSMAGPPSRATAEEATAAIAAAPGGESDGASAVGRNLLIETIGKNVTAWTQWRAPAELELKAKQTK